MNRRLITVRRAIEREEALRTSGVEPSPLVVEGTVSFVGSRPELLSDEVVRRYLVARTSTLYYSVASKLLDLVIPLHERGYDEEAMASFQALAHLNEPEIWDPEGIFPYRRLDDKVFKDILGHNRLIVDHPRSWGRLAVEAFAVLLRARWKVTLSGYEAWGEGPERYRADWFEGHHRSREDARWHAGQSVRNAIRQAARMSEADTFRVLRDSLLQVPYPVAQAFLLETLLDALEVPSLPWHVAESVHLLSMEAICRPRSTYELRRLLRRSLPSDGLGPADLLNMLRALRASADDEFRLYGELSDLIGWQVLSEEELERVEQARARGRIFPPDDPREDPSLSIRHGRVDRIRSPLGRMVPALALSRGCPRLQRLQLFTTKQRSGSMPSNEEDPESRLGDLRDLLSHPEAFAEEWLGTFLDHCEQAVTDLKRRYRASRGDPEGKSAMDAEECRSLLETHAPWWLPLSRAALAKIAGPVPDHHFDRRTDLLSWGSGDPIYESLRFLDELLAVGAGEPFDRLRVDLEQVISGAWGRWPPYLRATALAVLRPYHWATIRGLEGNLDRVLAEERDPGVLKYCLSTVLRSSGQIAARLQNLARRLAPLMGVDEVSREIGRVLGDAVIRARGDREPWTELNAVADLAEQLLSPDTAGDEFRVSLASGALWGACSRLRRGSDLTEHHARSWLSLSRRGVIACLDASGRGDDERIPVQPIISVLELPWSLELREWILVGQADVLERTIHEAGLASFHDLHYQLCQQLGGKGSQPSRPIPDGVLIRLCRASTQRLATWAAERTTTNDWGFAGTLSGRETGELMRLAFEHAADRELMRRELAPCIDRIGDAGFLDLATELRLLLRRG